jgi:hypothetical protein
MKPLLLDRTGSAAIGSTDQVLSGVGEVIVLMRLRY